MSRSRTPPLFQSDCCHNSLHMLSYPPVHPLLIDVYWISFQILFQLFLKDHLHYHHHHHPVVFSFYLSLFLYHPCLFSYHPCLFFLYHLLYYPYDPGHHHHLHYPDHLHHLVFLLWFWWNKSFPEMSFELMICFVDVRGGRGEIGWAFLN